MAQPYYVIVGLCCRLLSLHGSLFVISDTGIAHLIILYTLGILGFRDPACHRPGFRLPIGKKLVLDWSRFLGC
jgi:hypothetical protein